MPLINNDQINITSIPFTEQTITPATPASGKWRTYFKSDGLYVVDDTGTETGPIGAGSESIAPVLFSANGGGNQQVLGNGTELTVLLSQVTDEGGYYDPTTGIWTPPSGFVTVYGILLFGDSSSAAIIAKLYKNTDMVCSAVARYGDGNNTVAVQWIGAVDGNDTIKLVAQQWTGSNFDIDRNNSWFGGHIIR